MRTQRPQRHTVIADLALLIVGSLIAPSIAIAQNDPGTETTLVIRPHCISGYDAENAAEGTEDPFGACPTFAVEDPQTLRTPALPVGEVLDIDVVVYNPDKLAITRVRSWLSYDPNVLKGDVIEVETGLPLVTPGESAFSEAQGYVMIEGSAEEATASKDRWIPVARVQFTVLKAIPAGTVISFYDVQRGGHTAVLSEESGEETYVLEREPGVLHVLFEQGAAATSQAASSVISPVATSAAASSAAAVSSTTATSSEAASVASVASAAISAPSQLGTLTDGASCLTASQCQSGNCVAGICRAATASPGGANAPNGAACVQNSQCQSNLCADNVCIPSLDDQRSVSSEAPRTAFGLLQIRNLRVTTEGSSVFLAWDELASSQLKGYNVYYGTTGGRYIQRKTVEGTTTSLALRALPVGTTYYFAVRAVSSLDEESAFSQEVAITVGDPNSSTAPLTPGSMDTDEGPAGENPLEGNLTGENDVPGETGPASTIALLALFSAVIGTFMASRRQMIASTQPQ